MSGKKSRTKGHNYERRIRLEMIDLGYTNCNTSRFENLMLDAMKIDLTNTDPFSIQCKAVETGINYHKLLSEMPKDHNYNVVLHKRNRKEIAVMSKNDFYELLDMLIRAGVIRASNKNKEVIVY